MPQPLGYQSRKPDTSPLADRVCPKCSGGMSAGFLLDHGDNIVAHQSRWIAGAPEKSFWTGLKVSGRLSLPVITFRCRNCGYLESYAVEIS